MKQSANTFILALSLPSLAIVLIVSLAGCFFAPTYAYERSEWANQAVAQDMMNLILVVPLFLLAAVVAAMGSRRALLVWGGVNAYLAYTYTIYCFDIHFGRFFLFYCAELGLSLFSFLYFLIKAQQSTVHAYFRHSLLKIAGIFLMIISLAFVALWLSQDIRAIVMRQPDPQLARLGLPTNPVHVLDLSLVLPALFVTGLFSYRNMPLGRLLGVPALVFCILMALSIGWLVIASELAGYEVSRPVTYVMCVAALVAFYLVGRFLLRIRERAFT